MTEDPLGYGTSVPCPDYRFQSGGIDGTARIYAPTSIGPDVTLGPGTVVWKYATVLAGVTVGARCIIGACTFLGQGVVIGDDSRIHHGACLGAGSIIGDRVYVGTNATLTDVAYPHLADKGAEVHEPCILGNDVTIGCNAVLTPGVIIGDGAVIGAGAVVTKSIPPGEVWVGNPARPLHGAKG